MKTSLTSALFAIAVTLVVAGASMPAHAQCSLSDFNFFNFFDQNDQGDVVDECNDQP